MADNKTEPTAQTPRLSMEYDMLPDVTEEYPPPPPTPTSIPAPPPAPTPNQPPPTSPPSTTAAKQPAAQDDETNSEEIIPRVVQPPPPETPIQAETHPDEEFEEEVRVMILNPLHASEAWHNRNCSKHNRRNTAERQMTYRGWIWYNGTIRTLVGKGRENYNSMGRIRGGTA